MNTLRDIVCTLIVMVVVGYLALIPWCLYVLVGIAFVIIVTRKRCVGWLFLLGVSKTKYRTDKMIEGLRSQADLSV